MNEREQGNITDIIREEAWGSLRPELEKTKRVPGVGDYGRRDLSEVVDDITFSTDPTIHCVLVSIGEPGVGKTNREELMQGIIDLHKNMMLIAWEDVEAEARRLGLITTPADQILADFELTKVTGVARSTAIHTIANKKNTGIELPTTAIKIEDKWAGRLAGSDLVYDLARGTRQEGPMSDLDYQLDVVSLVSGPIQDIITHAYRRNMKDTTTLAQAQFVARTYKKQIPQTDEEWLGMKNEGAWPKQMKLYEGIDDATLDVLEKRGYMTPLSEKEFEQLYDTLVREDAESLGLNHDEMKLRLRRSLRMGQLFKYLLHENLQIPSDNAFIGLNNPSLKDLGFEGKDIAVLKERFAKKEVGIFLVRHGEPLVYATQDARLTDTGEKQIQKLTHRFASWIDAHPHADVLIARSNRSRTRHTARIIQTVLQDYVKQAQGKLRDVHFYRRKNLSALNPNDTLDPLIEAFGADEAYNKWVILPEQTVLAMGSKSPNQVDMETTTVICKNIEELIMTSSWDRDILYILVVHETTIGARWKTSAPEEERYPVPYASSFEIYPDPETKEALQQFLENDGTVIWTNRR